MNFDFGLRYDARFWVPQTDTTNHLNWVPEQRNWITPTALGWTPTQGYLTYSYGKSYCIEQDGDQPNPGQGAPPVQYWGGGYQSSNFIFTDRQGVKHTFPVNAFQSGECNRTTGGGQPYDASNYSGPGLSMDGFYAVLRAYQNITIIGPDGTGYGGGGTSGGTSQPQLEQFS